MHIFIWNLVANVEEVNRANKAGFTALHHAAQQGHLKVYRMLIQAGAEPNLKTNSNFTPIDIARRLGYVSIIEEHANDTDNYDTSVASSEQCKMIAPESLQEKSSIWTLNFGWI